MRSSDVPQDPSFLEHHKRGAYAVDEHGRYTVVATSGWQAETAATAVALEDVDRRIAAVWAQVKAGLRSPLAYHLAARLLTPGLLAAYAGVWRLVIWWHLLPGPFRRASQATRLKYATALGLSPQALGELPEQPASVS